jgi:hypothetical protein
MADYQPVSPMVIKYNNNRKNKLIKVFLCRRRIPTVSLLLNKINKWTIVHLVALVLAHHVLAHLLLVLVHLLLVLVLVLLDVLALLLNVDVAHLLVRDQEAEIVEEEGKKKYLKYVV